jgi:hypothetical protein
MSPVFGAKKLKFTGHRPMIDILNMNKIVQVMARDTSI